MWRTLPRNGAMWRTLPRNGAMWRTLPRNGAMWRTLPRNGAMWRTLPRNGAMWRTLPRNGAMWRRFSVRPRQPALAGVGRLVRLCGRFGGAGSRRPPRAQVRQLRRGQRPLALVHVAPLEIQARHGQRGVPGADGRHSLPRDRHPCPFARQCAVSAVEYQVIADGDRHSAAARPDVGRQRLELGIVHQGKALGGGVGPQPAVVDQIAVVRDFSHGHTLLALHRSMCCACKRPIPLLQILDDVRLQRPLLAAPASLTRKLDHRRKETARPRSSVR